MIQSQIDRLRALESTMARAFRERGTERALRKAVFTTVATFATVIGSGTLLAQESTAQREVPADLGFRPFAYVEKDEDVFPPGMTARTIIRCGDDLTLDRGYQFRDNPDFICWIPRDGRRGWLFVNHEIEDLHPGDERPSPEMQNKSGGMTRLLLDENLEIVESGMHVWQTSNNCSGIVTPWNTILTCEEYPNTDGEAPPPPHLDGHMYTWEVDPSKPGMFERRPALGRFSHEAAEFDLDGNLYQTEDQTPGFIYRFVPEKPGDLTRGELTALDAVRKRWVTVEDRARAHRSSLKAGATPFARPEGIARHPKQPDWLYFALSGGDEKWDHPWGNYPLGAVLAVNVRTCEVKEIVVGRPQQAGGGVTGQMQHPDNIRFDAAGNLYICEDHKNKKLKIENGVAKNHGRNEVLVWHEQSRELYRFAVMGKADSEWTGPWFAETGRGRTLFLANQKDPGVVYAIHPEGR